MTFFLIDDDKIFQFVTGKILKKINPKILIEKYLDGEEGITSIKAKLKSGSSLPDIVLLDINMPFMNGWEFLREFKKIRPCIDKDIQIYILTSSDDPEDLDKAKKFSELSGYLVKPVSKKELEVLIREHPIKEWYQPK